MKTLRPQWDSTAAEKNISLELVQYVSRCLVALTRATA
jgi:hypothetical protein